MGVRDSLSRKVLIRFSISAYFYANMVFALKVVQIFRIIALKTVLSLLAEILAEDVQAGDPRNETINRGAERFVRLLQFFADGDALRAMPLALAAADALGGKGGVARESNG